MLFELKSDYKLIKALMNDQVTNLVINGVIEGNNLGEIYVDSIKSPTIALVWAKNEMVYLVGNGSNELFNLEVENFILKNIKAKALQNGEECFNLEVHLTNEWRSSIKDLFRNKLYTGERVPFIFDKNLFLEKFSNGITNVPSDYEVKEIDHSIIEHDIEQIIRNEILKFWDSVEKFLEKGIGFCVTYDNQVIGTCISAFVSNNEYEIGINTYTHKHRGKGLATAMAIAFIHKCLEKGGIPHWTTEDFRKDSIAIANKVGFMQLPNYQVYYLPFDEFN